MTKKNKIIFFVILLIIYILVLSLIIPNITFASVQDELGDLNSYGNVQSNSNSSFIDKVENIFGVVQVIGTIVSVVCLIVIGIRYILGSTEEKAEYKKTMLPYVIGCVIIFGVTNILAIIADISQNVGP